MIDTSVRELYATGYLHNHIRLWLAAHIVHVRRVHWRAGADWLYAHLLDGDLASNHLAWQWVAGTGSRRPCLFDPGNIARYAPALAAVPPGDWREAGPEESLEHYTRSMSAVIVVSGLTATKPPTS